MLTRRHLLSVAGVAGLSAGLAACSSGGEGPGGGGQNGSGTGGGSSTPTYVAFDKVKPDLPGKPELGIPNGYFRYPDTPPTYANAPLPQTEPMTFLTQGAPPPLSLSKSTRFKQLCTDVGNELQITYGGTTEYTAKFQTTIAGNDLPDALMMISAPEQPKLLENSFTDLGEFIGGDLVKEYPGLASIPTTAWSVATLNGRLWGIPQARPPAGIIMSTRGDMLEKRGIDKDQAPKDGAELLAFWKEITDEKSNLFAMGAMPSVWLLNILLEMDDAPAGWEEEGGRFTNYIETEQYLTAVQHAKQVWEAGVLHPNSFSEPASNSNWWQSGVTQVYIQGFTNWLYFTQRRPEFNMGRIEIPKWDGGGLATKHRSAPAYGAYAAISKHDSPERVKEILRVIDYFAAPYGTEEYLRFNFGVEGVHYNMEDGVPTATEKIVEEPTPLTYFGGQSLGNLTGPKSLVEAQNAYLNEIMPTSKSDASVGLYSPTSSSKSATFNLKLQDMVNGVIQNRRTIDDLTGMIADWKSSIGDKIRGELEEAFQQAG